VSTEVGTCLSVRRPLVAGMPMLDGRGLAVSAAAFLPDCQSGNGLSGAKLDRLLGVSPQTARFLAHRVRHALAASRSRTSRRASPEDLSSHRVSLEHAGGLIFSSAASGASRPSGKTDS
jgi:hypothetical protein